MWNRRNQHSRLRISHCWYTYQPSSSQVTIINTLLLIWQVNTHITIYTRNVKKSCSMEWTQRRLNISYFSSFLLLYHASWGCVPFSYIKVLHSKAFPVYEVFYMLCSSNLHNFVYTFSKSLHKCLTVQDTFIIQTSCLYVSSP